MKANEFIVEMFPRDEAVDAVHDILTRYKAYDRYGAKISTANPAKDVTYIKVTLGYPGSEDDRLYDLLTSLPMPENTYVKIYYADDDLT